MGKLQIAAPSYAKVRMIHIEINKVDKYQIPHNYQWNILLPLVATPMMFDALKNVWQHAWWHR